jgi:hypothetical protein
VCAVALASAALAAEPASETCAVRLAEARFELDELREQELLAPVQLDAEQGIFDLVEPLWEANITARLTYLENRRDRDAAAVQVARSRIARQRGEQKLAVIERECLAQGDAAEARREYETLSCRLVDRDREIAAIDRSYHADVVEILGELRGRELVTEQRVIRARYLLQTSEMELRLRGARQRECEKGLAAASALGG